MKQKRNQLSHGNRYALMRFLDTTENRSKLILTDDDEMAKAATAKLGFPVSGLNIQAARKVLGIFKRTTSTNGAKGTLGALKEHVANLEARLSKLEQALA